MPMGTEDRTKYEYTVITILRQYFLFKMCLESYVHFKFTSPKHKNLLAKNKTRNLSWVSS